MVIRVQCIRLKLGFSRGKLNAHFGKFNFFSEGGCEGYEV